ncbi:hypothetical protein [Mycobacterium sp. E3198]|uniref:hypothetical protein n=1 Tax=Mycobacterium sp. E3198 TaxID=1834143 RepID=UPI000801D809|nr:hypothetical protein [Mycobacterium sp. E3198]OBG31042.1 hypothetical protein A5673_27720 [Mycobacterium sp. E3198]
MRRAVPVVALLAAACLAVPAPRSSATTGCAPGGAPPPPGAAQRTVSDLDWDGQPDTLWVGQFRDGSGRTVRVVGITTASGANSDVEVSSASPIPLTALAIDAQQDGQHQVIVSDGRGAHLYVFADCRLQTVTDNQGAPFLFDLQDLRDNGTGIGCGNLGPPMPGRHLLGLRAANEDGQWTVRRTEIDLNGTLATIGASDTLTAASAQDPAVVSAQTISCGDLTLSKDGVRQP